MDPPPCAAESRVGSRSLPCAPAIAWGSSAAATPAAAVRARQYTSAAAEAVRQAAAEGLTLERSERNATGFEGVYFSGLRFVSRIGGSGGQTYLGTFGTAEEASLAYARARAAARDAPRTTVPANTPPPARAGLTPRHRSLDDLDEERLLFRSFLYFFFFE